MSDQPTDAFAAAAASFTGFNFLPGAINYVSDAALAALAQQAAMTSGVFVSGIDEARQKRLSQPVEKLALEVGEIIGWRMWHIAPNGMLKSIFNGNIWLPGETMGQNDDNSSARIEDHGQTGVYAFRDRGHALKDTCFAEVSQAAFGTIRMWGTVIEHEYGYRAEFAAVNSIDAVNIGDVWNTKQHDLVLRTLRHIYKCE